MAPVLLELWGMKSTSSLQALLGPLWPGVVALDVVLSFESNRTKLSACVKLNCFK